MSESSDAAARLGEIVAVCEANNCDKFIPLFVVTGGRDQGAVIQMELRVPDLRAVLAGRTEMEAREKRLWELLGKAEDLLDGTLHRGQDPGCEVCKWIEAVGALTIIPPPPKPT